MRNTMRQSRIGYAFVIGILGLAGQLYGQTTPTTVNLSSSVSVTGGQTTLGGQNGTLTDALGTQGSNPGFTWFRYGQANSSSGSLIINSTSTATASLKYFTATAALPATNAAPNNFSITTAYSWEIISPKVNSTSPLWIRANDATPVNFATGAGALALNSFSSLATYNTRLNEIYKFDRTNFIKPGGGTIDPVTDGVFSYTFSGWDGSTFRSISLNYTPVPEPATILGLSALGFGLAGWRRTRRS